MIFPKSFPRVKLYRFRKNHDRRTPYDRRRRNEAVDHSTRQGERRGDREPREAWYRFSRWSSLPNKPNFGKMRPPYCPMINIPFCGPEHCWKDESP